VNLDEDLPEPELVEPPYCACKGLAPQMREHTRAHCSVLTTAECNSLWRELRVERASADG
jgi:hypothetical protein